jgi:gluconolactonase
VGSLSLYLPFCITNVAEDASNKRVLSVTGQDSSTFCTDSAMLQPNDLALSVLRENLIFLSGQNYISNTVAGQSGDLWTCDGSTATQFSPSILAAAGIHRTNGIETSPNGSFLYLSSAKNAGGAVVENKIMRFALDTSTGNLLPQAPELFYNFVDSAATDIDGMRTDTDGNLFVTRNGNGNVVKLSPDGELLQEIVLPGMGGPSNLEFGGVDGKTLFAIGGCKANANVGCAASFEGDSVGKAWKALQSV